jgi:hypothetical protein
MLDSVHLLGYNGPIIAEEYHMTVTPTDFRKNLFSLLDSILQNGKVLEINRNGHIIKVVPPKKSKKIDRLVPHEDAVGGESDDFVSMDWSGEWKPSI